MTLEEIAARLRAAWSADTSADADGWSPENPAYGQCAVTALVVQDHLGGDLRRGVVDGVSHYWNRLPDGSEVDLTIEQFPPGSTATDAVDRTRDYVLGHPATVARYAALRARV